MRQLKKQNETVESLKNYFLQCDATAAGSSQSNVSRIYILNYQIFTFDESKPKKHIKKHIK